MALRAVKKQDWWPWRNKLNASYIEVGISLIFNKPDMSMDEAS